MKKISHEYARNELKKLPKQGFNINVQLLNDYITQQMQKDNIAQKEHELFELTKEKHDLLIKYDHTSDENLQEELADDLYEIDMKISKVEKDIENLKWLYDEVTI